MEKTRIEVIELLEACINDDRKKSVERLNKYEQWVLSLNKEDLEGVIFGCALFKLENGHCILFSESKTVKAQHKFNVKIADIYLNFAKEVFYCK